MTVNKEVLAQIEQMNKEKELKRALKEVKQGKKKKAILGLLSFLKKVCKVIKSTVIWTAKNLKIVFVGLNSFRQAVNAHIDIAIAKTGPINPSKIRRRMCAGMTATCLLGVVTGYILNDKISDDAISFKEKEDTSVVLASEVEDTSKVNTIKDTQQVQNIETNVKKEVLSKDVTLYLVGDVSSKFELGTSVANKGSMVDSNKGEIKYGQFSSLSSREDYVLEFCRYLKTNHNDVYTTMFATAKNIGTKEFNECWENASQYNEFANIQIEYKWSNLVRPVIDVINAETKVDLNKSLATQEVVYSTVSQYGTNVAIQLLRNANLSASMSDVEIINAVQDAKIASLGVYTYTNAESYTDAFREIIKTRINNERIELTRLLGQVAEIIN